jgi:hypothetical protein
VSSLEVKQRVCGRSDRRAVHPKRVLLRDESGYRLCREALSQKEGAN